MRNRLPAIWAWLVRRVHTLDLLPQYLKAVYNAWHDYLWTALPVAPIVVCWMIGGPVNPPEWLVVSAFVWALMVAGYYTWRKDHERVIPKLGLRVPGFRIHKTPDSAQQQRQYVQILPECLSESPVEECTALLLRITRYEHALEQWSPTELDHAIPLIWSYSDAAPHTLYPGVDYRVNVFMVR